MKKSVTILVILFMMSPIAVHGQKETWSGYILRGVNGPNKGIVEKLEWISDGHRGILQVTSQWEDGQWKEVEKRENRYDHYGNFVELAGYARDTVEGWIEGLNMSSEFNDNGTVKSSTSKRRTSGQEWRIEEEEIFEYNEKYEIIAIHKSEHTNKKSHYGSLSL